MAKRSITPVSAVPFIAVSLSLELLPKRPWRTSVPMLTSWTTPVKTATSAKASGMSTKAVNGDIFFFMMTYMKTTIIA